MSKVMQALEESQRSHQALGATMPPMTHSSSQSQPTGLRLKHIAIALLPPLCVASFMAWHSYQQAELTWLERNVAQTVIVEVPFDYHLEPAPHFSELAATYRQPTTSAQQEWLAQEIPVSSTQEQGSSASHATQSTRSEASDDLLDGLDLSQLSPELAQRFESALNAESSQQQAIEEGDISNLAHQATRWYGKLPALNFQTHVYSSKPSKRWVKINGVEYSQGDWVNDELELVAIEQQSCVIRFKGELIEIPALYDWQG